MLNIFLYQAFVIVIPLGNGAKEFPQPFFTTSASSAKTRWPSDSVPQKNRTFPSGSCTRQALSSTTRANDSRNKERDHKNLKANLEEQVTTKRCFTYSSYKSGFGRTVIENKCKLPLDVSHNLISRIRTSISQSSVCFNNDDHFIGCLVQSILLLEKRNILNVALEQAKNVVHNRKQPNNIQ